MTVAMLLAERGIIPPEEWEHDADIVNDEGATVAMYLASYGIIPSKKWKHNTLIVN